MRNTLRAIAGLTGEPPRTTSSTATAISSIELGLSR
jgi:hypothetical protein